MLSNSKKLFKTMYLILDEIWEETQAENLRIYISDADPFLCDDEESADPVVLEDFCILYDKMKDSKMSDYDFIIYYLENLDPYYGDIKQYFLSCTRYEFEKRINSL